MNAVVDELALKAEAAFLIAARKIIEEARRAGDGILTWRDGRVVEISCDEAEQLLAAEERAKADQAR